jgi:hypothetical protein
MRENGISDRDGGRNGSNSTPAVACYVPLERGVVDRELCFVTVDSTTLAKRGSVVEKGRRKEL